MKAAVLESYRRFVWKDVPTPSPEADEALVRVSYAGICGTDMHIFAGDFHPRTQVPFIPGHEIGGVVEQAGASVPGFDPGEKVAIDPIIWCGACPACRRKHYPACSNLRLLGVDMDGGFAEYVAVPAHMLYKVSAHVPDRHVALVELYGIGFHANSRAETQEGDSIAIWGAGRVGQVILQAARLKTNGPIYMVDPLPSRLDIATSLYDNVIGINPREKHPVDAIMSYTGSVGVDIAFEAVGHAEEIEGVHTPVRSAIQSIRGGGTVCVLGLGDNPAPVVFQELIWKESRIVASRVSHGEFADAIRQLERGALHPDALVTGVMPGSRAQETFQLVEDQKEQHLKVLLEFD